MWFAHQVLGIETWSRQRQILESVRDHRRTAVKSMHGIGKTFTAACAALWFLYSFPDSRVITTATTWPQVEKLLWHELRGIHRSARYPLGGHLLNTELKLDDGRFAIGLSTRPEHQESFQGHHAKNLLLIFDEASGIPAPIFEAGEGYMTSEGARWLMIGNPTQPAGEFYDAFHSQRTVCNTLSVGYADTPAYTGEPVSPDLASRLVSKQWVEEKRLQWGEDSPMFQVRVLGEFPTSTDNTVVSLQEVVQAQGRTTQEDFTILPGIVACDVARFGSDETVIATRVGQRVRIARHYTGRDLMQTCGEILEVARTLDCDGFPTLIVDDDGVGGGVTDRLREQGFHVAAFRAGARAHDPTMYPNARSEAWFSLAEQLPGIDLDPDEQLAADLTAPQYRLDSAGRRVVEKKEDTKKRIGRSPDRADAVLLTCATVAPRAVEGPEIWT